MKKKKLSADLRRVGKPNSSFLRSLFLNLTVKIGPYSPKLS